MLKEIQHEPPNKLLNVNESDYWKYLADKYRIDPITFEFEALQVSTSEKMIPIEQHPFNFGAHFSPTRQAAYPRQVLTFHLPFSGDAELLNCLPSGLISGLTVDVEVSPHEIQFDVVNWNNDTGELKRQQEHAVEQIREQNENVTNEICGFNSLLQEQARQEVSARKALLLKQSSVAASLGIPLRRSGNVPQTFAVPVIAKKIIVKPPTSESAHSFDPKLDDATYQNILSIIHDMGVAMERIRVANPV